MKRRSFLRSVSQGAVGLGFASQAGIGTASSREGDDGASRQAPSPAVKTLLSFATEAAHAEEDFDFIKAVAEFLTEENLVGNFHLTGDYARALKRRGRRDVVQALARHEIGFHCNHHGARPFMAGYLEKYPWDDGLARWFSNESPGFAAVAELFSRRPTYYTTEFAKAPQTLFGSMLLGADVTGYLPVPMRQHSAVWFCNSLVPSVENAVALESFHAPGDREQLARVQLERGLERQKANGKDVLRVFLHSYKYYAAEPYDRLTMSREMYKNDGLDIENFPTDFARRPLERFQKSLETFIRTIRHHASNSRFVTFSQYREEFQNNSGVWIDLQEVDCLCRSLDRSLDAYATDSVSLSPAESLGILVRALRHWHETGRLPAQVFVRSLIGPRAPIPEPLPDRTVSSAELWASLTKIDRELDASLAVPSTFTLGSVTVGPGQLLRGLVKAYLAVRADQEINPIALTGENLPEIAGEPYFRESVFTRKGIYPDDFTGMKICELCRSQSWSWKPALKAARRLVTPSDD